MRHFIHRRGGSHGHLLRRASRHVGDREPVAMLPRSEGVRTERRGHCERVRVTARYRSLAPGTQAERAPIRPSLYAYFLTTNTLVSTESSFRKTITL